MVHRSASSHRWLAEREKDPFVLRARQEGYRSRAAFKLLEIDERFHLFKPGMTVLDLGAAPGGWTQVAAQCVAPTGRVVAVDLLPMPVLAQTVVVQGDFLEETTLSLIVRQLPHGKSDVLLSDMAPNMSGVRCVDQARGEDLAEMAMDFAAHILSPGGGVVIKLFQGPGFHSLVKLAQLKFSSVKVVKPKASRDRSAETYLVGLGFGW